MSYDVAICTDHQQGDKEHEPIQPCKAFDIGSLLSHLSLVTAIPEPRDGHLCRIGIEEMHQFGSKTLGEVASSVSVPIWLRVNLHDPKSETCPSVSYSVHMSEGVFDTASAARELIHLGFGGPGLV